MFRLLRWLALASAIAQLAGCAAGISAPVSDGEHVIEAPMDVAPGQPIAVVLKSHLVDEKEIANKADQQTVASCVADALRVTQATAVLGKPGDPNVRYFVHLEIETVHTKWVWTQDFYYSSWGMLDPRAMYAYWKRTKKSRFEATVVDETGRLTARVNSWAQADEAAGTGVFLFMLHPYYSSRDTESLACRRFSEELARLMTN